MKNKERSMVEFSINFLRFVAPRLIMPVLTLITLSLLARWLSAEEYASYLFYYAVSVIVSGLADGGVRDSYYLSVSKSLTEKIFKGVYKIKLIISIGLVLVGLVASLLIDRALGPLMVAMLLAIVLPVGDVGLMILRAKNRPITELFISLIEGVTVISILSFLFMKGFSLNFISVLFVLVIVGVIRSFFVYIVTKNLLEDADTDVKGPNLSTGIQCAGAIFGGNIYNRIPAIVLSGNLSVETYNALITVLTLIQRLELISTATIQAHFRSDVGLSRKALFGKLVFIFIVGLLMAGISYSFSDFIVLMFMGDKYAGYAFIGKVVFALIPIVLVCYGARYILQLAKKAGLVNVWLSICILISIISLHFSFTIHHSLIVLVFNLLVFCMGALVILYFSSMKFHRENNDAV